MSFIEAQDERLAPLWERILGHRFLTGTRDGSIPDEEFGVWLQQDYLFVEAAIPFIAALIPRAPSEHWGALAGVITALEKELALFEERAASAGVRLRGSPPSFTCHAYIQFLLATAHTRSYAEGFTVLYAAERAYHDSWLVVRHGIDADSPWRPFVENWAGDEFAGYVRFLGGELEKLASMAGPAERARMGELYRLALLYELAFWEMAITAGGWPATDDDLSDAPAGPVWNPDGAAPGSAWAHMSPSDAASLSDRANPPNHATPSQPHADPSHPDASQGGDR